MTNLTVSNQQVAMQQKKQPVKPQVQQKKQESVSFFDEKWSGQLIAKLTGDNAFTDWLQDKDKVCSDGKDDGKLGFWEGAKSLAKGLIGGIPKAIINHPLTSAVVFGLGAAAMVATGGAAAPILWGIGAVAAAGTIGVGVYTTATAKTDAEAKAGLEMTGTGVQAGIIAGATYNSTMNAATAAGVNTKGNIVETMVDAAKVSGRNIKANYQTWTTGTLYGNSNQARQGVQTGYQAENEAVDVYRPNINPKASVQENLANNPGMQYNQEGGYYYKTAPWGEELIYDPNMENGHWMLTRSADDSYLIAGNELRDNWVMADDFLKNGTRNYMKPADYTPGSQVQVVKQGPARFKVAPAGTKYMSKEGPATLQPKSVLRIDNDGHLYQSTVEFMFKKVNNLTPEQISMLKPIDPEAAAKYGY